MIMDDINAYIDDKTKNYIMADASGDIKSTIISILKKRPMSLSELARQMKRRREFITGYLEAMRHDGDVEVIVVGRSKVYRPKKGR